MSKQSNSLQDQVILVTGACGAIGRALCEALATQGAQLILCGRNEKKLNTLADALQPLTDNAVQCCQMDLVLAGKDDYQQLFQVLQETYGQLDGLIHCAALFKGLIPLSNLSAQDYFSIMQANLNARFLLSQTLLPLLKSSPASKLVFSLNKISHLPYWGAYGIAEAGCKSLCQIFEQELSETTVSVYGIELPPVKSPLRQKAYPFERQVEIEPSQAVHYYMEIFTSKKS